MIVCNPMVNREMLYPHVYRVNYNNLPFARETVLSLDFTTAIAGRGSLLKAIITQSRFGQKIGLISMMSKGQMYLVLDLGMNVYLRQELTSKCKMRKKDLVPFNSDEYEKIMEKFNDFFDETESREGLGLMDKQDPAVLTQYWVNCCDLTPETRSKIRFASEPKRIKE